MFGKLVRPIFQGVRRTFVVAGPVANGRDVENLLDDPITHPEGDEVFSRLTHRDDVYPADRQKAA